MTGKRMNMRSTETLTARHDGWGGTSIKLTLLASSSLLLVAASDNKPGWKLDADGKIEMKDGNPI